MEVAGAATEEREATHQAGMEPPAVKVAATGSGSVEQARADSGRVGTAPAVSGVAGRAGSRPVGLAPVVSGPAASRPVGLAVSGLAASGLAASADAELLASVGESSEQVGGEAEVLVAVLEGLAEQAASHKIPAARTVFGAAIIVVLPRSGATTQ